MSLDTSRVAQAASARSHARISWQRIGLIPVSLGLFTFTRVDSSRAPSDSSRLDIPYLVYSAVSAPTPKELVWVASSLKDLRRFPEGVRQVAGFALYVAQCGGKHVSAKPLHGYRGAQA